MKKLMIGACTGVALAGWGAAQPAYLDTTRTFEERAADLVSRMTLDEKVGQLGRNTIAVPRLGVAKYDYWNEALHGIQNGTGEGTSFPMPLSLAVTWDEPFIAQVAGAIADECRGHNQPLDEGGRGRGLTYWCPTINLARHPLWGRTNESYGEDPYVVGRLASAFVDGMKGTDKQYLKTVPTIKHYALNNHEKLRGSTSSDASEADIRDYYARVYGEVIARTDVPSLMSAYNAVNYTPSSANPFLLTTLLRETYGFTGFVVSDCGAVDNIEKQQKWQPTKNTVQKDNYRTNPGLTVADYVDDDGVVTKPGSVAMALMAGCDMDCNGDVYPRFAKLAHQQGLVSESQINCNVYNNLLARFKLGEFDPDEKVALRGPDYAFANTVETPAHRALADEAAARSVVLLKNEGNLLPLDVKKLRQIVLVGDRAETCFLGNYCGKPQEKNRISVFAGLDDYLFVHNRQARLTLVSEFGADGALRPADRDAIVAADCVVVMAADEHDDSSEGHDREALTLSRNQDKIARNVAALNKNTIVFLQTSNVVELKAFKDQVRAILWSSQNGQGQGVGFARQLFGEVNPSGKLTFTWFANEAELPGIRQYGLKEKFLADEKPYPAGGFTYQYFKGAVDYPFGYGLSYTTYAYANARVDKTSADANDTLKVSVDVTNTGRRAGSEVVQVYVVYPAGKGRPAKQIKAFAKVDLKPGETKTAVMSVDLADCCFWDGTKMVVPTGAYQIEVAASATDVKARKTVQVAGTLAETLKHVTVRPSDVAVKVGETLNAYVKLCLKDDRLLAGSAAKLTFTSSNPAVAEVCGLGVVTGKKPGLATITVKADYKGSVKTTSFPVAVTAGTPDATDVRTSASAAPKAKPAVKKAAPAGVDREALEAAIRLKVSGDDYDPQTLAAYNLQIRRAREVFFNPAATQAEIDAALRQLLAVKENLRDFRYLVANFPSASKTYGFNSGRALWIDWARNRDAAGREVESNFASHDPQKLELRFTVTFTPSSYDTPFEKAVSDGWIKLRSRDVAQKDNDPDLQVFGGTMAQNNEHNYGWKVTDVVKDWGTTEIVIPLATKNPDGTTGLPFIDKGFRADGQTRYSRGKIDWTCIDRFFMNVNFHDAFKKKATVTAKLANVRVVDVTLEEEREKLQAILDLQTVDGCDCPGKIARYQEELAEAKRVLAGENVVAIRTSAQTVVASRQNVGYTVKVDKRKLQRLLASRVKDLARYTPASVAAYTARIKAAEAVNASPTASQLKVNRAVRALEGAEKLLQLTRVTPRVLAVLLDGEKSVEAHHLAVVAPADLKLAAHADYTVTVRYDIKLETTHPHVVGNKWLQLCVNGRARVWGETPQKNNESALVMTAMDCAKGSPMTAYTKPGEWLTMTHEVPVAKLAGGRLTQFDTYLFNDTGAYRPEPDDGIAWNNEKGVKLTVRNIVVLSDKP